MYLSRADSDGLRALLSTLWYTRHGNTATHSAHGHTAHGHAGMRGQPARHLHYTPYTNSRSCCVGRRGSRGAAGLGNEWPHRNSRGDWPPNATGLARDDDLVVPTTLGVRDGLTAWVLPSTPLLTLPARARPRRDPPGFTCRLPPPHPPSAAVGVTDSRGGIGGGWRRARGVTELDLPPCRPGATTDAELECGVTDPGLRPREPTTDCARRGGCAEAVRGRG